MKSKKNLDTYGSSTDLERFHDPVGERLEASLPHVVVRRVVPHRRSLHHLSNYSRATAYRKLWSH
jgi:aromatic ring-cleaving dioxygenase